MQESLSNPFRSSDYKSIRDTVWFCSWGHHQSLAVVKNIWEENHGKLPG